MKKRGGVDAKESAAEPSGEEHPNVEVRNCRLGQGVFARRAIRRRSTIGLVTGAFTDDPDAWGDYLIDVGDGYTLDPAPPFRFLNHSCEPNARLLIDDGPGTPAVTVHVVALRAIAPGEELLIDYAWEPGESPMPCRCGADDCRQYIVSKRHARQMRRQLQAAGG